MQLITEINVIDKHLYPRRACPMGYQAFNEDWYISEHGDMRSARADYPINSDLLGLNHWLSHLMDKRWFDANTFLPTYFEACRRKGLQSVNTNILY